MMKPTLPYTRGDLKRIEQMVERAVCDPDHPISEELAYDIAYFRLTLEACQDFVRSALTWLEKNGRGVG